MAKNRRIPFIALAGVFIFGVFYFASMDAYRAPFAEVREEDPCNIVKSGECIDYTYPEGFRRDHLRILDANSSTQSILFRSNLPLQPQTGAFDKDALVAAMKEEAVRSNQHFPEKFNLHVFTFLSEKKILKTLEKCELNQEFCYAKSDDETFVHHWSILGDEVDPYSLDETSRTFLAETFSDWDWDALEALTTSLHDLVHNESYGNHILPLSPTPITMRKKRDSLYRIFQERRNVAQLTAPPGTVAQATESRENAVHGQTLATVTAPVAPEAAGIGQNHEITIAAQNNATSADVSGNPLENASVNDPATTFAVVLANASETAPFGNQATVLNDTQTTNPLGFMEIAEEGADAIVPSAAVSSIPLRSLEVKEPIPNIIVFHCHHGKDRTGEVAGAYKMKYLNFSLGQVWKDNQVFLMNYIPTVNMTMWYCLFLQLSPLYKCQNCNCFHIEVDSVLANTPPLSPLANMESDAFAPS